MAAFLFIALPDARLRARGEWWGDYGLPSGSLRERATWVLLLRGARTGLATSALVLPAFGLVFAAYALFLPRLSLGMAHAVAPYDHLGQLAFRLPPRFLLEVVLQVLVVALPEELFYRGYLQTSWARGAPSRGKTFLGVRLGAGFLLTQLLFAAGHLVGFRPLWRLATFLPALWFGWLREKTDGLAAPIVAHALANLFIKTLEASFYP